VPRLQTLRILGWLWLAFTFVALAIGLRLAFTAPTEVTMGDVQRIFYYHVPSNIAALIFPYVNLVGSLGFLYLRRRDPLRAIAFDALAVAAAEVTVVFATIGLVTGMLWAKPVWGIWWTWDERLTTFLLLWLLYVSYLLVRRFSSTGQTHTIAAVLSVFAAIDVPIVYMSIRWWRTQHPSPVFFGGPDSGLDPSMAPAFYTNFAAWIMWGIFLIGTRYALERRRQRAHHAAVQTAIATPEAR
jgi:heme exporter protein C